MEKSIEDIRNSLVDINIIVRDKIENNEKEKEVLKKFLQTVSSTSTFEDDIWIADKTNKHKNVSNGAKSIYFTMFSNDYKDFVKYFALYRIGQNIEFSSIGNNLTGVLNFLEYLEDNYNGLKLKDVNKKIIYSYRDYLEDYTGLSSRTKESYWTSLILIFKYMLNFDEMPDKNVVGYINPFVVSKSKRKSNEEKYIPEDIIAQMDKVLMENNDIPIYFRTVYWICRLIPSRITEVCSMKIECIKPYMNYKIVSIPTFKQEVNYIKPKMRNICLMEDSMGEFLLDLIKKQIDESKEYRNYIDDEVEKEFLFVYKPYQYMKKTKKWVKRENYLVTTFKEDGFNRMFKRICEVYNIKDKSGKIYNPTSHQLRHVGITDRLYEGFRLIDIMSITGHKNSSMISNNYSHIKQPELDKISREVLGEEHNHIVFKGRILNFDDERKIKEILRRPFAHRIGKLGLCSDISNCRSGMYECLKCDRFIPNADELEYFEAQVEDWRKKVKRAGGNQYLKENAQYNLELNQNIVKKIKLGLYESETLLEVAKNNNG